MTAPCGCLFFPAGHRLPARYGLGAPALRYAALGYAVIPLARGGKRPHAMLGDRGGIHLASRDEGQIMDWWSLDMAANIGVATGSVNRLAVVDLDVKHGGRGPESWGRFLNGPPPCPDWPNAPVQQTPSGGLHYWLRADGEVPERPGILPGVDVKGDGGLVVAAPSFTVTIPRDRSGGTTGEVPVPYEWVSGCPHALPDVPSWFPGWIASALPAAREGGGQSSGASGGALDDVLPGYLAGGIPYGHRNREMYRICCGLYRRHGTDQEGSQKVMETVRAVYDRTDHSDFGWTEVLTCTESARRFVERSVARENARNAGFLAWLQGRRN